MHRSTHRFAIGSLNVGTWTETNGKSLNFLRKYVFFFGTKILMSARMTKSTEKNTIGIIVRLYTNRAVSCANVILIADDKL